MPRNIILTPKQIKLGRLQAKLTQKEIGAEFGLSRRWWIDLESGKKPARPWLRWAMKGLLSEKKK